MSCYFNEKVNESIHTLEKTITEIEIKNQIKTMKIGKSAGQDCISNEHPIYCGEQAINKLKFIYNLILKQEYLPNSLRHGIITPFIKEIMKSNSSSYRVVTLSSVLGKRFEKIVLECIKLLLLEMNDIIPHPLVFRFVKDLGAVPAMYTLKELLHYYLELF